MSTFQEQFEALKKVPGAEDATATPLSTGAQLIRVPNVQLPEGWVVPGRQDRIVTVVFFTPPGYPSSQPDCFWVEPVGLRLIGGGTPNASNDSNPIPGHTAPLPHGTWFSWHVQQWNPNRDSLSTYYKVIKNRLFPAR